MRRKHVVILERALADLYAIADYYTEAGGKALAHRFSDALSTSYLRLSSFPGVGSLRYESVLDVPGVRVWPVTGFPYLIFYCDTPEAVEIWRILHAERDLLAELPTEADDADA